MIPNRKIDKLSVFIFALLQAHHIQLIDTHARVDSSTFNQLAAMSLPDRTTQKRAHGVQDITPSVSYFTVSTGYEERAVRHYINLGAIVKVHTNFDIDDVSTKNQSYILDRATVANSKNKCSRHDCNKGCNTRWEHEYREKYLDEPTEYDYQE